MGDHELFETPHVVLVGRQESSAQVDSGFPSHHTIAQLYMSSLPSTSSTSISSAAPALDVHPYYNFDDADLVLLSSDGMRFRVHSTVLKLASSVFRDMFSIQRVEDDGPVALEETMTMITILLNIMYTSFPALSHATRHCVRPSWRSGGVGVGKRIPPIQRTSISISELHALALAADKYDIPRVTDLLKAVIMGSRHDLIVLRVEGDPYAPVKIFGVAWSLGWSSIAAFLSSKTLSCNLHSEEAQDLLFGGTLSGGAARELLSLHRERRIWIYNAFLLLVDGDDNMIGNENQQSSCRSFLRKHFLNHDHFFRPRRLHIEASDRSLSWWKLKAKVLEMLETDASGTQLLTASSLEKYYSAVDLRWGCSYPTIDPFREHLRSVFKLVPNTIGGFRYLGRNL